jgi:hypothetical protein
VVDEEQISGKHTQYWDEKDRNNNAAGGIYICRLRVNEKIYTRKILINR